ncbi:hypothetical protein [Burkholderia gladioli]|uniref:hypothetical protein n=1 Tax=Burkholderia gladioli TaxID=28095 RepID=UPI00164225A0|nr:hypothetical protein [Burkholderia gladioli]
MRTRFRNTRKQASILKNIDVNAAAASQRTFVLSVTTIALTALSIVGAIFVWIQRNSGFAYKDGALWVWGFEPDSLISNTEALTYMGYYAQELYLIQILLTVAVVAFVALFVAFASSVFKKSMLAKRKTESLRTRGPNSNMKMNGEAVFWVSVIAIVLSLVIVSALPTAIFGPAQNKGEDDAYKLKVAIDKWDVAAMKKWRLTFVEIKRERAEVVAGVPVACSDKFCAIYSPVGAVHSKMVPLTDIESWSTIDFDKVPPNERPAVGH